MEDTVIKTNPSRRTKFAIFDFDWTLVKPKQGRKFPKDQDDWQYLRTSVPTVLQTYAKTHHIVIVTDQSKPWKIDQIKTVLADLKIDTHITVIIGVKTQKPDPTLFNATFPNFKPDLAFYVGDAAGRPGDWSDKDKEFAKNIKVKFITPEEIFPLPQEPTHTLKPTSHKEVIIMIGYPASGKSTIAKTVFSSYYTVSGDVHKTANAMLKEAEKHVTTNSIVFDSTAGTKAKRHIFLLFAQKHNLPIRAIWVNTSIDDAMERNKQRAAETKTPKIPDVAFYIYRKNFEIPTEAEGFKLIVV
jgi:bifunctional polynucleotide phosphatase/kinase